MCKFHKDVARDIATDPVTGEFSPGKYCVALTAMAKFRIEQYMPAMHGCDGFVSAQMTTPEAVKALENTGLIKPLAQVQAYRDAHIGTIRAAMELTAGSCDLSMQGLNNPDRIVRDGYKKTCCAAPDPTKAGPFMDEAVVQLFEGYDDEGKTWARRDLTLADQAHKPEFEAIRMATEHFISQPGVTDVLRQMFEDSLVRVFEEAKLNIGPILATDGCVMCGHGSRAPKPQQP